MNRREFITLLGGAAATWPIAARAQQAGMPVIGVLSANMREPENMADFRDGLKLHGFVEGSNVAVEYRWADGQYQRLPALVAELVRRPVSVIFATGGNASAPVAKAATKTIPIVFTTGSDPLREGLVESFARPGGNVTGITFFARGLTAKRLELLRELVPGLRRVAVLVNPTNPNVAGDMEDIAAAGSTLGLEMHFLRASTANEINDAFASLASLGAGALFLNADAFLSGQRDQIVALVAHHRVPAIYPRHEHVAVGGLVSYATHVSDTYRQAGNYVGRILRGEKAADLPVQAPTKYEMVVNLKTAKALGLDIPATVLARADEVIE